MPDMMTIRTFGAFSVSIGGKVVSDQSRSQKAWHIFKYLITNRGNTVSTDTLIEMLWPDVQPKNPLGSLQSLIKRLRKLLNDNGEHDKHILFQHNSYRWNTDMPVVLDAADFENLIQQARTIVSDEAKRPYLEDAIKLYSGDYLHETASEMWAMPVTSYYRRTYLRAVEDLADIYTRAAAYEDIIMLCNTAIQIEPYDETLHERLIQALLINGETASAQKQYRHIADVMKKMFGASPSDGLQTLYQEIRELEENKPADPLEIKRSLENGDSKQGAYFCTSGTFRRIYQLDLRSDERLKFPLFLAVVTIEMKEEADPKAIKAISQILRQCLMRTLRKSDVVTHYAKCQYLLLLSAYQEKDAEAALVRVKRMFAAQNSNADCKLQTHLFRTGGGQGTVDPVFSMYK